MVILFLILVLIMCIFIPDDPFSVEEEVVTTTTTTTTTTQEFPVLQMMYCETQRSYYVIDPVDKTTTWVNPNDDMYEDAGGNVWAME